jgi:hypothetical protein
VTRRVLLQTVLLAVAMALGTAELGWWIVPLLGAAWGLIAAGDGRPPLAAALAAGLGWVVLLVLTASEGPIGVLADRASGVMGVGREVVYLLTLLFPMAVAWGAAVLGEALARGRAWST